MSVMNGSAARIHWIKFTRPSTNFTLGGITLPPVWTSTSDADSITVSGGSINLGVSRTFTLTGVAAANLNAPSANWIVEASDDAASGSNPFSCSGPLGTQIGTPDTTAPVISNVVVSNITSSSAIVTWDTDEAADSTVNYGTTSGYGSTQADASFVTSHSVNLTGLSANTAYHYEVVSKDPSNNSTSSSDNTFLTQAASSSTPPTITTTTPSTTSLPIPTVNPNPGDKEAPVVQITTDLSKPFKEAPSISGTATDNFAVYSVEYSLDDGVNWLPVDSVTGLASKSVSFAFKPAGLPDGNYSIIARAIDPSANVGVSSEKVLIIDVLPPLIGPSVVSFGPLVSQAEKGVTFAVIGIDEKITLKALGGPISVNIEASSEDKSETKVFTLTKAKDSELWSGVLAFSKAGTYTLLAKAVDGAANKTERVLNKVVVAPSSKITDADGKGVKGAKVTAYYFDNESNTWSVWDSSAYSQKNPQTTNQNGEYNFFFPAGKYYLKVEAVGYHDLTTSIFEQSENQVIESTLKMEKALGITLGDYYLKIPTFVIRHPKIVNDFHNEVENQIAEKKNLTDYDLTGVSAGSVKTVDFNGKPTVLAFLSSWAPGIEDQIRELDELGKNSDFNVEAVVLLESKEKFAAFEKIGGYNLAFIADPLGAELKDFNVVSLPSFLIVGRDGTITNEQTKFLSKEDLQAQLSKL